MNRTLLHKSWVRPWLLGVAIFGCGAGFGACSLNPQPFPPEAEEAPDPNGADATADTGTPPDGPDGGDTNDAASGLPFDAGHGGGFESDGSVSDGSTTDGGVSDCSTTDGGVSDGSTDARLAHD